MHSPQRYVEHKLIYVIIDVIHMFKGYKMRDWKKKCCTGY